LIFSATIFGIGLLILPGKHTIAFGGMNDVDFEFG
jgi:hypothetical protein